MKDFRRFASLLGGALLLAGASVALAASGATGTVTILHTNDSHGRYLSFPVAPGNATAQTGDPGRSPQSFPHQGEVNGFARLASAIESIRRERGADNVLLLHGGDTFSDDLLGNITKGEATIRLMNAVGYQYMALGNHDFDYGAEQTRKLQELASFPMRGANVIDKASGKPFLGEPVQVFKIGGLKVGVLALGYHNTAQTGSPKNTESLRFESGIEAARRYVPVLRRKADLVVVLSHQGSKVDRLLARKVPGIDIIVGAHSHDFIEPPERTGNTWMVQALSDSAVLGELRVAMEKGRISSVQGQGHVLWSDQYPPDPAIEKLVRQMREPHEAELEAVIGQAAERIGRQYKSESPFDHLAGEMMMRHAKAEVAFLPGVGYGVSLMPGPIRREQLYTLLPHPSRLVTMRLTGAQIQEILEQSATNQKPDDPMDAVGGLIQTAGLRWTVDLSRPSGQRIRDVAVGDSPLDPERSYRVVTHSGMLAGIHRYETFADGADIRKAEETVTEVVEKGFRQAGPLRPKVGYVTLIKAEE
ncbi:bifunctional UDP-sugar hydrolase/5'-nucleotidase [Thermithiobacillus plumbiphilus]|uniref:Bifunctional UDP-sugar hydrolase/5'-nucleotidase n=1 Tax=Thermithiobacillus plumbiphilus TaxID=1729899 RepID=A0ABU9DE50_9PROT